MARCRRLIRLRHGRDEDAAGLQHREGARLNLAADEVDDGIDAAGPLLEAAGAVIDDLLRAETVQPVEVAGAGRGEDPQARLPGTAKIPTLAPAPWIRTV